MINEANSHPQYAELMIISVSNLKRPRTIIIYQYFFKKYKFYVKNIINNNPTKGKKRIYNIKTLLRSLLEKDKPIPAGWAFGMGPK